MAEVNLSIGGNMYNVSCREGEEAHLLNMGAIIDAKALEARTAVGGLSEVRQLLFAALLLADELNDARKAAQGAPSSTPDLAAPLSALAARVEALASSLEKSVA
jgi:cell division protein ZapA